MVSADEKLRAFLELGSQLLKDVVATVHTTLLFAFTTNLAT